MDTPKNQPENPLLQPDHELPAPHDMLLEEGNHSASPPSSHASPSHKAFPLWILPLIALLIVLLGGVVYFFNLSKQAPKTSEPTIVSKTTPTSVPDPMANWQLYQNPSDQYSFQYPPTWYIGTDTSGSVCLGSDQRFIDYYCSGNTAIDPPNTGFTSTRIGLDTTVKIPKNTSASAALKLGKRTETLPLISEKFTTVDTFPAYRAIRQASSEGVLRTDIEYTFLSNDRLYRLWFELNDNNPEQQIAEFDRVANTFRLLSPDITGNTVSPATGEPVVACTMDAKLCPDGSSVGRVGPKCEFAACPKN